MQSINWYLFFWLVIGFYVQFFQEAERAVTKKEGINFARKYGCLFIECSAKTRVNVQQCFEELILKVHNLDTFFFLSYETPVFVFFPFVFQFHPASIFKHVCVCVCVCFPVFVWSNFSLWLNYEMEYNEWMNGGMICRFLIHQPSWLRVPRQ